MSETRRKRRVVAPRRPQLDLPRLRPYRAGSDEGADGPLRPDGDHDGVRFADLELAGVDGSGSTFLDCGLYRCGLDETKLERARLLDSVLEGVRGVGTRLGGAELRDVELSEVRLGGTQLHGAQLNRVLVRGGKIDFLNLRQATLRDVVFESCVLIEPDFGEATLERVAFPGSVLRSAEVGKASMTDVDLREAAELEVTGDVTALSGAVVGSAQLMELAPAFAAALGVRVEG